MKTKINVISFPPLSWSPFIPGRWVWRQICDLKNTVNTANWKQRLLPENRTCISLAVLHCIQWHILVYSSDYQSSFNLTFVRCFPDVTAVCILEAFQNQQSMLLADKVLKLLGKEKAKEKYKVGLSILLTNCYFTWPVVEKLVVGILSVFVNKSLSSSAEV